MRESQNASSFYNFGHILINDLNRSNDKVLTQLNVTSTKLIENDNANIFIFHFLFTSRMKKTVFNTVYTSKQSSELCALA